MHHFLQRLPAYLALILLWISGCTSARVPSDDAAAASGSAPKPGADILPEPAREFRAVWIATVANIDWPSEPGLPTHRQQEEMRALLDRAAELNLNAVILQVRPAADALYASELEPWSEYLTGQMGRPPEPLYDPLTFAIDEAHRRGLELHAWFNPYRAYHASANSPISDDHISRTRPEVVRQYGDYLWLDPGEPGAHAHTLGVILDVVDRYDIDGVHFDDYFYPYRAYAEPGSTEFPDSASWSRAMAAGTTLSRDDWRRQNVDNLIEELYREIKARKPHVKFGISPFGIWRPGYPEGTTGFDAYSELYADARKWLREGWVDYFTPQIYYRIDQHDQPYPLMLRWWIEQNVHDRHIWPGNYTGRAGRQWPVGEIPGQIYVTRAQPGATGNVHFSMRAFMRDSDGHRDSRNADESQAGNAEGEGDATENLVDVLLSETYAEPALVPATPWLDNDPPARPTAAFRFDDDSTVVEMTPAQENDVWVWVVRMRRPSGWSIAIVPGAQREYRLEGELPDVVTVSAVDRLGNEGSPVRLAGPSSTSLQPQIIPHGSWESQSPIGYAADAMRRNVAPGDSLAFRDLVLRVESMRADTKHVETAQFSLSAGPKTGKRTVTEGEAFIWNGYRIAVPALNTGGGLGGGLAELEIATVASLPDAVAASTTAGGASERLRVPHNIRRITLHHSGSPEPLAPEDDPVEKLRGLQAWGQSDRNWWDVPYHFLIDLEGRIYEGRDYRYMGETNTTYDPSGHLLISVIGNYNEQEATPAQIEAITDLMAWASARFGVPPGDISGHGDWAETSCPGRHLQKYLDDGTFVEGVRTRLRDSSQW